jgi:membrane protease YdiL (CAAX protease family)
MGQGDENRDSVPWGVRHVALGVLCVLIATIIVGVIVFLLGEVSGMNIGALGVASVLILGCVMVAVALYLGPGRHKAPSTTLGIGMYATWQHMALAAAVLLASLGFNLLYAFIVDSLGWDSMLPPDIAEELGLKGASYFVGVMAIVLWGPFSEELFFRGFIFPGLANRLGWIRAGLLSAALFGLAHGNLGVIIPAFFTGTLLAWLYWRTGSLWPCLLAHATQNAIAFSLSGI